MAIWNENNNLCASNNPAMEEGGRERGREGGREGEREGGRERGREGEREQLEEQTYYILHALQS